MNDQAGPSVPPSPWEPPQASVELPPAPVSGPGPVPFEDLEAMPGFWERVGAMFRLVFTHPLELFDRVPRTEGLGAPWRFLLLLSVPALLIFFLIFSLVGMGAFMAAVQEHETSGGRFAVAFIPAIFGCILVLMPLFAFLGMVIGGALNHFFLWMWGGLRPGVGLGQTIRAYGYASAFLQIGGMIPYLGLLIQLAGMVVIGMGLARMHKTDTWRGVCAVITPLVAACCCLIVGMMVLVPILVAAGNH